VPERNLAVEGVSVWYGPKGARVPALRDVSLTFMPGELTLVMGPSGSGKTTLLSLLGCLLTPDEGSVFVDGAEVGRLKERQRTRLRSHIGFIFQAFRLFHSLPALENVMIAAEICGERRHRAQAARKLLVGLGLGEKLGLKPDELSGGEKQRVAIARALLSDPPIVLADEPTASLDFQAGRQIAEILKNLALAQQRTVVVVSHDHRWTNFAQRTIVLEDGRVVEDRRNLEWQKQSSMQEAVAVPF
jgi:putative ABC transport system ATP-binding protein